MLTASTQVSYSMRANFLGGQNKELIRTGDANPPQILKLCDAERRFVPKIELLACNRRLRVSSNLKPKTLQIMLAVQQYFPVVPVSVLTNILKCLEPRAYVF